MRIQDIMTTSVETIQAHDYADVAWDRMNFKDTRYLVVLKGNNVLGVISDKDLGGYNGESLRKNRRVEELMSLNQVTAVPKTTLKEAADICRSASVDCIPILDNDKLVGLVTVADLLEVIGVGVERTRSKKEYKPDMSGPIYRRSGHPPKKK